MVLIPIVLAAILIVVAFGLAVHLARKRHATKLEWLVAAVSAVGLGVYVLLVGGWHVISYYLRPVAALLLLAALVISAIRIRRAPWWHRPESRREWFSLGVGILVATLFAGFAGYAVSGTLPGRARVELAFPLQGGVAYVGQGGANPLLNYHNTIRAQAFALDILALNAAGRHASGLAPSELDRYTVFRWDVHSPCTGTVVEAHDGLDDLIPPATDTTNRAGNHVVVRCVDTQPEVDVLLAHLNRGSVAVEPGAEVAAGQVVGKVGNTGNTSEPHLHVHAVRTGSGTALDGEGVPISFNGRFLVRNDLVFGG